MTDETPTLPHAAGFGTVPLPESHGSLAAPANGYALLGELARGGMGVVYKARDRRLGRTVALKMILAGGHAGTDERKRFEAEARAAAALSHPGIVPVYEVGEIDGQPFLALEFVDGPSLHARLANGPLPPREAAAIVKQVAEAVTYAHAQGIVHRDLKPHNVLIGPGGRPRVTDFGLAKRLDGDGGLPGTGQILGTPQYMAPEQAAVAAHTWYRGDGWRIGLLRLAYLTFMGMCSLTLVGVLLRYVFWAADAGHSVWVQAAIIAAPLVGLGVLALKGNDYVRSRGYGR